MWPSSSIIVPVKWSKLASEFHVRDDEPNTSQGEVMPTSSISPKARAWCVKPEV